MILITMSEVFRWLSRSKWRIIMCVCGAVFVLFAAVASFRVLCGLQICTPSRDFAVTAFEMPSNLFPKGAVMNRMYPARGMGGIENGGQTVYWSSGDATGNLLVWRYGNDWIAEREYWHEIDALEGRISSLYEPSGNPQADWPSTRYLCGMRLMEKRCYVVMRRREYVLVFFVTIDSDMDEVDMLQIAKYLNGKGQELLER
jgi:hypothetical protein